MDERFIQVFTTEMEMYFEGSFSLRFFTVEPFFLYINIFKR